MPCYRPIPAWRTPAGDVVLRIAPDSSSLKLPCRQCPGCLLDRSRKWAIRMVHELRFHEASSFITLTYDDDHLPRGGSLHKKHFQDFMKRLRKHLFPKRVRFFHVGEYGEQFARPHYHAIIFGYDFLDRRYDLELTDRGDTVWRSPELDLLWTSGLNQVGSVTFESCAYVARYVTKKIFGDASHHYQGRAPEYATQSRRPGIGSQHFDQFVDEIYRFDEVVSRGVSSKPPEYYDKLLEKNFPVLYERVKEDRECARELSNPANRSPYTLRAKELALLAKSGTIKRRYEDGY